ncbi:cytochrome P450 [Acrocarpospora phusangensis]|uniref:Cytochrome P450 n=1 Tax=Acrocarpospora phusangensis TaxID=1070424 RepID=A0A919UN07_9ACTN|nr:cytochrome P450 [Acrocarpospora phusangensis]GIH23853.1 cytochrome P450 [Acrocarpospora phusangensis]
MIGISGTPRFPFHPYGEDTLTPHPDPFPDGLGQVELPDGQLAWLITRHEYVRQVLRSPDFSSDFTKPGFPLLRPVLPADHTPPPGMFIRMDGLDHTRLRRMFIPEFMIRHIRALEPMIRDTVVGALEDMRAAGAPADLIEWFALPVPSKVICHLLGVPYADHEFFQERSRTLLAWSTPPERALAARDELRDYLAGLIARRLREGGEDLISRIAAERVATGEMAAEELVGASLLLLVAGHETTANMIGLSTLVLLRHPEQLRRLRERPESMDDAVEELLRYLTIVRTGVTRAAVADTEIGGQAVKAGEGVIAWLSAANGDAAVFDDPEGLDLSRGSHQHVAFGFGVHQCLGQPLARAELRIALGELLTRMPDLALAVDPAEIDFRDGVIFGARRLPVTW